MAFDGLIRQVLETVQHAAAARAEADRAQRATREENDHYVTGGVNWNGFSLEHLIKMVAERASPQQLDALAGEWRGHGEKINQASGDLQQSLDKLMQYWSGDAADESTQKVTSNAAWINELGTTAQNMAMPIEHAGGALQSAQNTMPGKPSSNWWATAGGGAAAGFAVGGPVGAAFGAAIGGIASAFGFGSNKKKLKRKAVQTMQRYETALLGIDGTTPQFGSAANGSDPGPDRLRNPGTGVGTPDGPPNPAGGGLLPRTPGGSVPPPSTTPALAEAGPGANWKNLTGLTPGSLGQLGPGGLGSRGPGLGGFPGGLFPGGRLGPGGVGGVGGRGGLAGAGGGRGAGGRGPGGRGATGRGGYGTGGVGGRGGLGGDKDYKGRRGLRGGLLGEEEESSKGRRGARGGVLGEEEESGRGRRGARGGALGAEEESSARGRGGALGEEEEARRRGGARGRFGRGGLDPHGNSGYGGAGGAGSRKEEDEEHRRRFPVEEDPFSSADLKAAPPVIGL